MIMCLSTVYRKEISPDNIIMKNVQRIECHGQTITLIDLLDREITLKGELTQANLTDGTAVVTES